MHVRLLAPLLLSGALAATAGTTNFPPPAHPLSLRECIDLALVRNLDLQIEHLSAEIVKDNLSASYGAYAPTFSTRAKYAYETNNSAVDWKKQNPYVPYELKTETAGSGLSGQVPFGLSYDFNAEVGKYRGATDLENGVRQTNEFFSDASVTLRQHLLKDFWIDQSRETVLVRRKELKMSQQALLLEVMKTVLSVELAYFDLAGAREEITVEEKALELKQQLLSETKRRVQVGDLPPRQSIENDLILTSLASPRGDEFGPGGGGVARSGDRAAGLPAGRQGGPRPLGLDRSDAGRARTNAAVAGVDRRPCAARRRPGDCCRSQGKTRHAPSLGAGNLVADPLRPSDGLLKKLRQPGEERIAQQHDRRRQAD
jgi:hypothetical protein